jgi:hypothetical protein
MAKLDRNEDGSLPSFAFPGGYPLYYVTADNGFLCPDCANGENGCIASDKEDTAEDAHWHIVECVVHYGADPIICDHCEGRIGSAYGPVEDES